MSGSLSARSLQIVAGAIVVAPVPIFVVFVVIPPIEALAVLLYPALFAGLAGLFAGMFLHRQLVYAQHPGADRDEKTRRFFLGTIIPLAITEAAALLGAMAFSGAQEVWAVLPLLFHIVLGTYVWPRQSKFDYVVGRESESV